MKERLDFFGNSIYMIAKHNLKMFSSEGRCWLWTVMNSCERSWTVMNSHEQSWTVINSSERHEHSWTPLKHEMNVPFFRLTVLNGKNIWLKFTKRLKTFVTYFERPFFTFLNVSNMTMRKLNIGVQAVQDGVRNVMNMANGSSWRLGT